jgi:hypothetical protein
LPASCGSSGTGSKIFDRVILVAKTGRERENWTMRLPASILEELIDVRERFLGGGTGLSARSLAEAVLADLANTHGLSDVCSRETMRVWLAKK